MKIENSEQLIKLLVGGKKIIDIEMNHDRGINDVFLHYEKMDVIVDGQIQPMLPVVRIPKTVFLDKIKKGIAPVGNFITFLPLILPFEIQLSIDEEQELVYCYTCKNSTIVSGIGLELDFGHCKISLPGIGTMEDPKNIIEIKETKWEDVELGSMISIKEPIFDPKSQWICYDSQGMYLDALLNPPEIGAGSEFMLTGIDENTISIMYLNIRDDQYYTREVKVRPEVDFTKFIIGKEIKDVPRL